MYKIKIDDIEMTTGLKNILIRMGILFLEKFTEYTLKDIREIRGLGRKRIEELLNILSKNNLTVKPDDILFTPERLWEIEKEKIMELVSEIQNKPTSYNEINQLKYLCRIFVKYLQYEVIRKAAYENYGLDA